MKIYFAYRTAYKTNNRFIKAFEADSILDFFQKYWHKFTSDDYEEFLGTDIYSFPIERYNSENDSTIIPTVPQSMDELINEFHNCLYVNDLQSCDDYVEVWTDDDEIELIWCVFTENYKNQNMDKLAIWFYDTLPTQVSSNTDFEPKMNLPHIKVGDSKDCCYLIDNTIYDSENSENINSIQIIGTNLADLVKNLKSVKFDDDNYAFNALKLLQAIAVNENTDNTNQVLTQFTNYDVSQNGDFENLSTKDDTNNDKVFIDKHIAELCVSSMGCFYNYYVLFDDKWASSYPQLANSLIHFGTNWQFVQNDDCDDD